MNRVAAPPGRPEAFDAESALCVTPAVWRSIVVPGSTELRLAAKLSRLGARVALWPGTRPDAYDLDVVARSLTVRVDLKEFRSAHRLVAKLRSDPPRVPVLLPRTHEWQKEHLDSALRGVTVLTESWLVAAVRSAVGEA